ncbi:MAG: RusA family crossover junction endodeoxyribonuclease [Anaerolineae bacterium]|nr:RusA family crossover junction endodeoxyribonuclease [Anaerolineae bacterium]
MAAKQAVLVESMRPLSGGAKHKRAYQNAVAAAACQAQVPRLASRRLYSKVYYFHRGRSTIDADNLSKPTLDALTGLAYEDDAQIVLRVAAKIDLDTDNYEFPVNRLGSHQFDKLLMLLSSAEARVDVLYVEVGEVGSFPLNLGVW